ncbi:hypothetical protein J2Z21_005453 [Streptomyces griseochromogenes]|uniref:DUF4393 domain-containing protein n=1 Tax=Streptomyces griseochromogenes TaxID=68214 RepID=A0ABS4LYI3_9ACTN|nr:hypothetical protein [Streptomyces griseochromogenes]MBP2052470.1 hypothetical protein [Streptomyces griseochromogenes]
MTDDRIPEESVGNAAEVVLRATTSVGAGVTGATLGLEAGAAALAAKEVVDAAGQRLIEKYLQYRRARASRVLSVGGDEAGMDLNRFVSSIESSPRLLALMAESVQAAMDTPLDIKVQALGRCLGRGVRDEAKVDEERLRIRGLARIDEPEVKLMELLERQPPLMPPHELGPDKNVRWPGWRRPEILAEIPGYADVLDASIARLTSEGLAVDDGINRLVADDGFREMWILTNFGRDCLRLLRSAGSNEDLTDS